MSKCNDVGFKGQCRKCLACGDVKIWDYPNVRRCPTGKNHRWRPREFSDLTEEENKSIDEQVKFDEENRTIRNPQIIINNEEDAKKYFPQLKDAVYTEGVKDGN